MLPIYAPEVRDNLELQASADHSQAEGGGKSLPFGDVAFVFGVVSDSLVRNTGTYARYRANPTSV